MNEERDPSDIARDHNERMLAEALDKIDWQTVANLYEVMEYKTPEGGIRAFVEKHARRTMDEVRQSGRELISTSGHWQCHAHFSVDEWEDPQTMCFTMDVAFLPIWKGVVCLTDKAASGDGGKYLYEKAIEVAEK